VYHNPAHRWFFKRNMDLDDVVIFKLHDGDALQKGVTSMCTVSFLLSALPRCKPNAIYFSLPALSVR
jgi:hypothetical protein